MAKKIAIISTWKENCGIAHYASFLKKALETEDYAVDVFSLPRNIFSIEYPGRAERDIAEKWIEDICSRLQDYDVVNLQFEPGIFGRKFAEIFRRARKLVSRSRAAVITFHSVSRPQGYSFSSAAKKLVKAKMQPALWDVKAMLDARKWEDFYRFLNDQSRVKPLSVITHTKRDKTYLSARLDTNEIYDVPLIYLDRQTRENLPSLAASSSLGAAIPFPGPDKRYIGVFGFISDYKGYMTALQTLNVLDDTYELLLFGALHEGLLTHRMKIHPFVQELLDYIKYVEEKRKKEKKESAEDSGKGSAKKFSDRVHFMGSVSDDDMLCGMMLCDAVLFPYINSEQTASGPISLAIELDRHIIASRNTPFLELAKYYPDKFSFCDIGNYFEIAQKVRSARAEILDEKEVNGMRWVYFPEKGQSLYPDTTRAVYKKAIEG